MNLSIETHSNSIEREIVARKHDLRRSIL